MTARAAGRARLLLASAESSRRPRQVAATPQSSDRSLTCRRSSDAQCSKGRLDLVRAEARTGRESHVPGRIVSPGLSCYLCHLPPPLPKAGGPIPRAELGQSWKYRCVGAQPSVAFSSKRAWSSGERRLASRVGIEPQGSRIAVASPITPHKSPSGDRPLAADRSSLWRLSWVNGLRFSRRRLMIAWPSTCSCSLGIGVELNLFYALQDLKR